MRQEQKVVELPNHLLIPFLEKGDRNGKVLILLHGVADSCVAFEPMIPFLSNEFRSLAVTLRGHGDAGKPETGYSTNDFVEDLVLFLDKLGIEKAVLLGASSGGFPTRSFAAAYPERTEGLILLGSPATLGDKPGVVKVWNEVISLLTDPVDESFVRRFAQGLETENIPPDFLEVMLKENLKVPSRVWIETIRGLMNEPFPGSLGKIEAQTLILWGDQDVISTREDQQILEKLIPNAQLKILSGLGHLLYWEAPDRIVKEINEFVRSKKRS